MMTFDLASSGYKRGSCCCGRAVVRQPYMTDYQWAAGLVAFRVSHKSCGQLRAPGWGSG